MRIDRLEQLNKPYKIYAEILEDTALEQFIEAMEQDFVVEGALMPDCHTGYSLPIGAVVACKDVIVPSYIGFDLGCGMWALKIPYTKAEILSKADEIFKEIYKRIPTGFTHNQKDTLWLEGKELPKSEFLTEVFNKNGLKQLGSLGGG